MWRADVRILRVVFFVAAASMSVAVAQTTVYVDASNCPGPGNGSSTDPYCKIQDGICYLKRNVPAGGTVQVRPGTYREALRLFKGISVVSTDGPSVTTLDATDMPCVRSDCTTNTATTFCSAVMITSVGGVGPTNADRLEGFHITGGKGYLQPGTPRASVIGGGIFIWGNSSPTVTRNEIVGNAPTAASTTAFYGGGIYIDSDIDGGYAAAKPAITTNLIEGNSVDPAAGNYSYGVGGGIYSGFDAAPTIDGNTIRNNRAGSMATAPQIGNGGGMAIYGRALAGTPLISRNLIQANVAADFGGGIMSGHYAYGAGHYEAGVGTVENNVFEGNDGGFGGGGAHLETSALLIRNNTFVSNAAEYGGAVDVDPSHLPQAVPTMANDLFTFNTARRPGPSGGGGGLWVEVDPVVRFVDLFGNLPNNVGGWHTDADYLGRDGNVSVDPAYVDRPGEDFHLRSVSPVIDVGDNSNTPSQDKDGNPRPQNGRSSGTAVVDMGAYEFSPDYDRDGIADWQDPDDDDDGILDAQDCAPRCKGTWSPPGAIPDSLRLSRSAGGKLTWTRGVQGHVSNVYRGTLAAGQVWSYNETCIGDEMTGTELTDAATPNPGSLYYYLVSARNACGESADGTDGGGNSHFPATACADLAHDTDGDGIADPCDDCAATANSTQTDADGDGVGDACDVCPAASDPGQVDGDGDGHGDVCDCAPGDPSIWSSPGEIQSLRVDEGPMTHLSWAAVGQSPRYDVAGGSLSEIRRDAGIAAAVCLTNDRVETGWDDARPDPSQGGGYYYLVRAQNLCGTGSYGSASSGADRHPVVDCP